ncbi:MAG: bifunctional 5,10-methylenetetrahydrofolate dehydrogenase/5,10-methenyltetrahydrofolate cyclohydrolase [Chloroflexi bacterium]|nr:bifunctional 5,10-methylenetetrahydrofolate dehydrogenase/5,10-methenyltetrahydrofolate cyclohydrolase [Chloroflexota bacterium]
MTARLLGGRALASDLRADLADRVARLAATGRGRVPRLAILRNGDSPAASMYAAGLERVARGIGLDTTTVEEPTAALLERVAEANRDPAVAGIVVAYPLGDPERAQRVIELIDPDKDVDGATPTNAGRLLRGEPAFVPATALAVIALIEAHGVQVAGRRAVIVGRSAVVGRPVASLLLARDATVVICHRATADLAAETRRAELLVAAAGVAGLVRADMVSPSAIVIDCGINSTPAGVVGDVDPSVAETAAAMSPVPGGVGPVTPMMVLRQTVESAERIAGEVRAVT